jgi:ABC-type multidrug transport system fused ATPase/permease subunit
MRPAVRRQFTSGQLSNFVSIDAARTGDGLIPFLHWNTWSALISMGVSLYFLHRLVGVAAFVGFGALVVLLPPAMWVSRLTKTATVKLTDLRDHRTKLAEEAVTAVRMLKVCLALQAGSGDCGLCVDCPPRVSQVCQWEQWMYQRIKDARDAEAVQLRSQQMMSAWNTVFGLVAPVVVSALTLFAYTQLYDKPLQASTAFAATAWLDLLRQPLNSLPFIVTSLIQTQVSLK